MVQGSSLAHRSNQSAQTWHGDAMADKDQHQFSSEYVEVRSRKRNELLNLTKFTKLHQVKWYCFFSQGTARPLTVSPTGLCCCTDCTDRHWYQLFFPAVERILHYYILVWSWRGKSEFLDGGKRVLKLHRLTMLTLRTQPFRNSVWWQLVNPTASTAIVVAVGSRDMSCRVVIFVIVIGNGWKVRCSHWMQLNVKFFILPNQLGQHLENEQTKLHFQYDTDAYTRARFEVMKILPTPYDMNIFSKK